MKALDLFCGGGGACIGLQQAGFEVVGIDIETHKNYPGTFIQADVLNLPVDIHDFDFVWASPPCQRFSIASKCRGNDWEKLPDFIPDVQELLESHPFTCIENVPGSPIRPDVILTGRSMGLPYIQRKRHFETSFFMLYPKPLLTDRKHWDEGKAITVTKSMASNSHWYKRKAVGLPGRPRREEVKDAMGIPQEVQMTYSELGESVPPAYSKFIADEVIKQMRRN